MVKMDDAVIARLEKNGHKFEILVDPYLAFDLKHGKNVDFGELLAMDYVMKDSNKGDKQSDSLVKEVFSTLDINTVASRIIKDGDVQLTTDMKREMLAKRKKEIISYIAANAYDPKAQAPHPPARIENAIAELKISFDLHRSVAEQANAVVKELKRVLPISMEKVKFEVRIPSVYSGKASALVHRHDIKSENWGSDGSLSVVFEVSAGEKTAVLGELNHLTKGNLETKILEA